LERRFNPATGDMTSEIELQPTIGVLREPRARAATFTLERQLMRAVDMQVVLTSRQSSNLATLRVPSVSGPLQVESTGTADYREAQFSVRRVWTDDQQVFVSYVRSSGRGEINDFTSLFGFVDAPLLQPGATARLSSEARNRVIAWGTINLPRRVVLSPVTEWRSGFPYSVVDNQYVYSEAPNSREFPSFWAIDLVTYKTFTVKKRSARCLRSVERSALRAVHQQRRYHFPRVHARQVVSLRESIESSLCVTVFGLLRPRPAIFTSAAPERLCSTGSMPVTSAAPSSCASRTPTPSARRWKWSGGFSTA
jgi:hypothetical protein